jgi:hypothetical protein
MEALWKPQSHGSDEQPPADPPPEAGLPADAQIRPAAARSRAHFASRRSPVRSRLAPLTSPANRRLLQRRLRDSRWACVRWPCCQRSAVLTTPANRAPAVRGASAACRDQHALAFAEKQSSAAAARRCCWSSATTVSSVSAGTTGFPREQSFPRMPGELVERPRRRQGSAERADHSDQLVGLISVTARETYELPRFR